MTRTFIAVLTPESAGGYSVGFPDCRGCNTQGDTFDQAIANAREALDLWLEGNNTVIAVEPAVRLAALMRANLKSGKLVVPVSSALSAAAKTVPITITVAQDALATIDATAKARGLSRSAFLTRSALEAASRRVGLADPAPPWLPQSRPSKHRTSQPPSGTRRPSGKRSKPGG